MSEAVAQGRSSLFAVSERTERILIALLAGTRPAMIALREGVSRARVYEIRRRLANGYWRHVELIQQRIAP